MMNLISLFRLLVIVAMFLMMSLAYAEDPVADYDLGVQLAAQGKFAEARAAFNAALASDPQNLPVGNCLGVLNDLQSQRIKEQTAIHLFLAFGYFNRFQVDAAIQELNQAINLNPNYALAYKHRGDAFGDKGQLDKALADYNRALAIDSQYLAAYLHRGTIYSTQSQFDQAISEYNRALEINPNYTPALYSRGNLYANLGKYDQAVADYDRALEIDPRYGHAYVRKGLACEKVGRPQEALAAYKAYLQKVNLQVQDPRQVQFVRDKIKSLEKQP
jgi:tetratricopeptide (TPR) repeat protein